ncbi:FHA domain-containing protein [Rarobacter faecitabidus]
MPGSESSRPCAESAPREAEDRTVLRTIPDTDNGVHIELAFPDGRRTVVHGRTVIGRTTPVQPDVGTSHIQVIDPTRTISKMHLVLDPLPTHGGTWVTDLASTNGTSIIDSNGQIIALTPMSGHWVDATSTLLVGDVDIRLTVTHGNLECST